MKTGNALRISEIPHSGIHFEEMTVSLRDHVLSAMIGIHDHEQLAEQRIRVNLELSRLCPVTDHEPERNTFGIDSLADLVEAIVGEGHTNLVESLAERIAADCLDIPLSKSVRVRVEKLDIIEDAASVGIEIERRNEMEMTQ